MLTVFILGDAFYSNGSVILQKGSRRILCPSACGL